MRCRHLFGLILLIGPVAPLVAAPPAAWAQEPASIFGIELGKPFPSAALIGDCPMFAPFRRENLPDELCVRQHPGGAETADSIALDNVPLQDLARQATVALHDGQVRAIRVPFAQARFEEMKALLIERYGAAHSRSVADGAETLLWNGHRCMITLSAQKDEAGQGLVEFRDATSSDS